MSGANKGRKSKMNRPGSKKNLGPNQNPAAPLDGAYGNQNLVHVLLSLMGKKCRAKVRNGSVYEGIFHTFNPKMDVSMNVVHKCDTQGDHTSSTNGVDSKLPNGCPKEEELIEQMIFPSENFVSACFEDVDLSFAALDASEANGESLNQARSTLKSGEKKFEVWNGGGDIGDSHALGSLEDQSANGWDAGEMFSCNEEKFGVKSDYDPSLTNYTMALDLKENENPERLANAERIAQEIESGVDYKQRADLENDERISEEDKFSRVVRERDMRRDGRGPRDREREIEHGGYHEKERGDRDMANQMSPHNYRSKHDYDRIPANHRARGRGRESREWERRNQPSYNSGPNMGPSRPVGSSGNRNQFPISPHLDGSGGQGKPYHSNPPQSRLPPRLMRQNENNSMHTSYSQPPKTQRQTRMQQRSSNGRGPWVQDFGHPGPNQLHQESPGQPGGVSLSRTSSSSSNTSVHTPNHRKHPSTSSQEEQAQHSHQHINQTSSSPTGGASIGNNNSQSMTRSQTMPLPTSVPQTDTSYATIASRSPAGAKPQSNSGIPDMSQLRMAQGSPTDLPNQSPHSKPRVVTVHSNATYTYTPKGSTPPINHHPSSAMSPQMAGNMGSPRMHHNTQPIHSMGDHSRAGQMMGRVPQQNVMPTSLQQQTANITGQIGPRQQHSQANNKIQSPSSEQQKQQIEKTEDGINHLKLSEVSIQPTSVGKSRNPATSSLSELKEFGKKFKLSADVRNKESSISISAAGTQPTANKVQQRQSSSMPQPSSVMVRNQPPHPSATMPQQTFQSSPQQQQQSFPITMSHSENVNVMRHGSAQATPNMMIPSKMAQHPGTFSHMQHAQQMNQSKMTQQIPGPPPNIQQFSAPSQQQTTHVPPQTVEGTKVMNTMVAQQTILPPVSQKLMTSPKVEPNHQPVGANVHVPTGPPLSQANPPAVITVSAAASSPIVSSHYPTATTQPTQNLQNQQEQSPTVVQAATPSNESSVSSPNSALNTSITSPTSANAKALNPEAQEFKPRTPAKTARAPTPQTQMMYVPAYATNMPPSQTQTPLTPVYNAGQMDHMPAPAVQQMYQPFHQQQFLLPQQVVQQIHGPPQQFATFENPGQVYTTPAPQATMMPQNNRMTAMPTTPQYQPEQSPNVYVPIQTQGPNYLQQRPQSANTPTATHVTAASPANPSSHQVQQPTGHPTAMVPPHGVQGGSVPGQVWMVPNTSNFMVVQGGQPHLQHPSGMHVNQPPPQPAQYMPAPMPQSGMSNVPAQQKSQPQAMQTAHFMSQPAQRYNQYQSPPANN